MAVGGSVRNLALEDAAWPSVSADGGCLALIRGAAGQGPCFVITQAAAMMSSATAVADGEQPQWRP